MREAGEVCRNLNEIARLCTLFEPSPRAFAQFSFLPLFEAFFISGRVEETRVLIGLNWFVSVECRLLAALLGDNGFPLPGAAAHASSQPRKKNG